MEASGQLHTPAALPPIQSIGGCVGPRAGLDDFEKRKFLTLLGLEIRPLGRPARSQSLYRLRYPGSRLQGRFLIFNPFLEKMNYYSFARRKNGSKENHVAREPQLRDVVIYPPSTHWIGGWVDPRAGLDDVEKKKFLILPGLEHRTLGRPASSQSLYRLRYPNSFIGHTMKRKVNAKMWFVNR
jgi:hypothetical protein